MNFKNGRVYVKKTKNGNKIQNRQITQIKDISPWIFVSFLVPLTLFSPMFHVYTSWKRPKTFGFLTFSGGIVIEHWAKAGWVYLKPTYEIAFLNIFNFFIVIKALTEVIAISFRFKIHQTLKFFWTSMYWIHRWMWSQTTYQIQPHKRLPIPYKKLLP